MEDGYYFVPCLGAARDGWPQGALSFGGNLFRVRLQSDAVPRWSSF